MVRVTLTIRRYQSADAAATARVFREAVRRTAAAYYDDQQIAAWLGRVIDVCRWNTHRLTAHTVVAEAQGEVVGFSDLTDDGELDMLYVHPDHGRHGIARALVEEARRPGTLLTRSQSGPTRSARSDCCRLGGQGQWVDVRDEAGFPTRPGRSADCHLSGTTRPGETRGG